MVRRQTAQRTRGNWVTVTGWREGVELLIDSILPVEAHWPGMAAVRPV